MRGQYSLITKELNNTAILKSGDYKKGIDEVLSEVISQLNDMKGK